MKRYEFERLVSRAVDAIPDRFSRVLKNIIFIVEQEPSEEQLRENDVPHGETLLGFFEGVMLGDQGSGPWELPGRIIIFQGPAEDEAVEKHVSIADVVRETVWHEVAHYLGMDEEEVARAETKRRDRKQ